MRHVTVFFESKIAKLFTFMPNFSTIMLFGMVFTEEKSLDQETINHEWYHTMQYRDLFSVGLLLTFIISSIIGLCDLNPIWWAIGGLILSSTLYYIWYGIEYLINYIKLKNKNKAYHAIKFEKQAYALQGDFLSPYKHFSWLKF